MPSSVRVVFNDLAKLAAVIHVEAARHVTETATDVLQAAQEGAAVDTTSMRESGHILTSERSGYSDAIAAAAAVNPTAQFAPEDSRPPNDTTAFVEFAAGHAVYIEFGTVKMGAQPFLTPAVTRQQRHWAARWRDTRDRLNGPGRL